MFCCGCVSCFHCIMTSSDGNIFHVTGPLYGLFTGHRWIPLTKANDAELWCFLWSNGWVSNRDAADLRRHRTHYDVTVMEKSCTYVFQGCFNGTGTIDQSHKSHNPPFRTEICTFLFWMVHCGIQAISGICELGQLHHCANTCKATWENMYELCEQ